MTSTDPIADMLSRIRNAIRVNKNEVNLPYSKMKENLAKELKRAGFIDNVKTDSSTDFKRLLITINVPGTNPKINQIERVSKPGRRMYSKADDIPKVMNGRGVLIVSTSSGLMTDEAARKKRVGGELICKVY
jgi:small subunit ribosomal protein S8